MKYFEEQVILEIDEHGFGVFISAFGATATQGLFCRTNVNETRQIFRNAQPLGGEDEIAGKAGEGSSAHFLDRDRPGSTLDNDTAASQSRCVRYEAKLERMKAERNNPVACERSKIFAVGSERDVVLVIDENFSVRGWNGSPASIAALGRRKDRLLGKRIKDPDRGVRSKICCEKAEMKEWFV